MKRLQYTWFDNCYALFGLSELLGHLYALHYTILLVFKRFFSALENFVVVSAVVHAAPIVGAAV